MIWPEPAPVFRSISPPLLHIDFIDYFCVDVLLTLNYPERVFATEDCLKKHSALPPWGVSRVQINYQFDRDRQAALALDAWNADLDGGPDELHLRPARKTPRNAPCWAYTAWRKKIAQLKTSGASDRIVRALHRERVDDLTCLVENFDRAAGKRRDGYLPVHNAKAVAAAWEAFYPIWIEATGADVVRDCVPLSRSHPASLSSLAASLTPDENRTRETYRKLKTRKSRGTGQRRRGPSTQALAVKQWEQASPREAAILHAIIVGKEPAQFVARQQGMSLGAVLEVVRLALKSLRLALDSAKSMRTKGPRLVPQVSFEGGSLSPTAISMDQQHSEEIKH